MAVLPHTVEASLSGRPLVLVAGPECSALAGVPALDEICIRMAGRVEEARREQVAVLLAAGRTGTALALLGAWLGEAGGEALREALGAPPAPPAPFLALAAAPLRAVVTTAWDDVWADAWVAAGQPPGRLVALLGRATGSGRPCFGPADLRQRVETEALRALWARAAVLLVGFGPGDPTLGWALSLVGDRAADRAVLLAPGLDAAERAALEADTGLTVVVPDGSLAETLAALADLAARCAPPDAPDEEAPGPAAPDPARAALAAFAPSLGEAPLTAEQLVRLETLAREAGAEAEVAGLLERAGADRLAAGDRAGAATALAAAGDRAPSAPDRARLWAAAAALHDQVPTGEGEAGRLYALAFAADPHGAPGAERLADLLEAQRRWHELAPVLEALIARSPARDPARLAALALRLGRCAEARADEAAAIACYERARDRDPAALEPWRALARIHHQRRRWADALTCWQEVERREHLLAPAERAAVALALGEAALAAGTRLGALECFRKACDLAPDEPRAWRSLAALCQERGEVVEALAARRRLLPLVDARERAVVWDEIGDLLHEPLGDAPSARAAYDEALRLEPGRRRTLHKRLELETAAGDWDAALATLAELARREQDPLVRARYLHSAALVHRDHRDRGEAQALLEQAHAGAPDDERIFSALERLLADAGEWRRLRRLYRGRLRAMPPEAAPEAAARLWSALGELCLDHLDDRETASLALEAAARLDPSPQRRERLAAFYAASGPPAAARAIAQHQAILATDPGRTGSYRALRDLFARAGDHERQYHATAALVALGEAEPALVQWLERNRPAQLAGAGAALGPESWAILEEGDGGPLGRLLAQVGPAWLRAAAPRRSAVGLPRHERIPLSAAEADRRRGARRITTPGPWFPAHALGYAARILARPAPELFFRAEHFCPLSLHPVLDEGGPVPALIVGGTLEERLDDDAVVFALARQVALLGPRWAAAIAWATPEALAGALLTTLVAAGARPAERPDDPGARRLARALERNPGPWRDEALAFAAEQPALDRPSCEQACRVWLEEARRASDRAAFLVMSDLGAAGRALALETAVTGAHDAEARVLSLAAFSIGEAYAQLRAALAIPPHEEGARRWSIG